MEKIIQATITNLVKIAPSGVGLGVTTHALVNQKWTQAALLSFLTACSSIWMRFSGKFMEEAEKEAEERGGGLARWIFTIGDHVINAIRNWVVSSWRHLASDFEDKYFQRLTYICRNYETQGLDKDQVLKLQQVFVPLKISQKSLSKISPDLIQDLSKKFSKRQDIGQIVVRMASDSALRRLAILGSPGSGKTTLLRYLTLAYTTRQQRKLLHPKAPPFVPVLIYLRDVRKEIINNSELSMVDLIHHWLRGLQKTDPLVPPPNWFANKLKYNKCLILLDGLDEIADETERQKVSLWVDVQMKEYPEMALILSSRPLGYRKAKLSQDITMLEVQPFNFKQVEQFIHNWYLETEIRSQGIDDLGVQDEAKQQANDLVKRIRNSSPLVAMAVNPLLLTMITTVHRRGSALPGKRVKLYEEICQVLLEKRQRAKSLLDDRLTVSQKQSVLQFLAFVLMCSGVRFFALTSRVDKLLQQKLSLISVEVPNSKEFLRQIREVSGLLIAKEEGVYEFAHLSFQEYLASAEIRQASKEYILINALESSQNLSWWTETIRLYCAQTDASKLIQAALNSNNIDTLSLAFDCREEGLSVHPSVRTKLENRLIQGLESANNELFRIAAEVKLSRRLNQFSRVDEKILIHTEKITCAEYQLFINEMRHQGKNFQPDDWNRHHFLPDTATQWIRGIRASDAQAFCQWLSQRTGQLYRLPSIREIQTHCVLHSKIGVWSLSQKSNDYKLMGISVAQWQEWRSILLSLLNQYLKQDFGFARILSQNLAHDRDLALAQDRDLAHAQDRDLAQDFALDHALVRILAREREQEYARTLALDQDRAFERDCALARDLERARNRSYDRVSVRIHSYDHTLAHDLDRNLTRTLARARALARDLAHQKTLTFVRDLEHINALARDLALDRAFNFARSVANDRDYAFARYPDRDHRLIRAYLIAHIAVLELLLEAYERAEKREKWIVWDNEKNQQFNHNKDALISSLNSLVNIYIVFLIFYLRQINELPSWEGLIIIKEDPQ